VKARYHILLWLAVALCLGLSVYDGFLRSVLTPTNAAVFILGIGLMVSQLPIFEHIKLWLFEATFVRRAKKAADEAEEAAQLAQIHFKILSALGSLPHKPALVETFTTSLDRAARSGSPLTREDVDKAEREAEKISSSYVEGGPWGQEQVLLSLERSGLLQRVGEDKEPQAWIVPKEKRSLIVEALAYK